MIHETSCGAVLFTKTANGILYTIVVEKNGTTGLPKGHVESGETHIQCALREIKEETGIDAHIVDGFREEISYILHNGHCKHVIFFAASYEETQTPKNIGEVKDIRVLGYDQAYEALTYQQTKDILYRFTQSTAFPR